MTWLFHFVILKLFKFFKILKFNNNDPQRN
jgi:hypothetical protein